MKYVEKHVAVAHGNVKRISNPTTKVFLEEGAHAETDHLMKQMSG